MIVRCYEESDVLSRLSDNVFSLKIRSLLAAYGTSYDFCRFYLTESNIISSYYGEYILSALPQNGQLEEQLEFIEANGGSALLMPNFLTLSLFDNVSEAATDIRAVSPLSPSAAPFFTAFKVVNIMQYAAGTPSEEKAMTTDVCEQAGKAIARTTSGKDAATSSKAKPLKITANPPLDSAYEVLATAFSPLDYESWYVDMSHKIRHNQGRIFVIPDVESGENSDGGKTKLTCAAAVTLGFIFEEAILISMIGARPKSRKKGYGTALLSHLQQEYRNRKIYAICEKKLCQFYEKSGFVEVGTAISAKLHR